MHYALLKSMISCLVVKEEPWQSLGSVGLSKGYENAGGGR